MKIKEHANELKSLLGVQELSSVSSIVPESTSIVDETPEELTPEPIFEFDYNKVKKFYFKKAKESIKKIVRVVINDSELIDKSFIADKIDQDAEQLAQLYYQQRKTEVMQEANMESVRTGNVSPRMFETFNLLGKNLMDIAKQISEFQISIKENYSKIKFDSIEDTPMIGTASESVTVPTEMRVFKNTKEMNNKLIEARKMLLQSKNENIIEQ